MNFSGFDVLALICGLAVTVLCLNSNRFGEWLNLMDVPVGRKQHAAATPLMGGVALLTVFLPVAVFHVLNEVSSRWSPTLLIWLASIFVMAAVGIADDRHSLSPKARLLISFLVFAIAAVMDPTFNIRVLDFNLPRISIGLGTWWFAIVFTVICCVGLVNAINMADGKNGLVLGLSIGWLVILSTRAPQVLLPLIILFGIVLGVLFIFNMKGLLFLGDGGAYAIATALGLLSIIIYNTPGDPSLRSVSAEELMVLFAIPVFDSFRLTYVRMRQGRSPMDGDRDHLHHHLQTIFGWPKGLYIYWMLGLLPAATLFSLS